MVTIKIQRNIYLLVLLLASAGLRAQQNLAQNTFLQNDITNPIDEYYIKNPDIKFHSSLKPFIYSTLYKLDDQAVPYRHVSVHTYTLRKEFYEGPEQKKRIALQILPQLDVQQGMDLLGKKMLNESSGGIYLRADVNEKFSAAIQLISGYVAYPNFTDTIVKSTGIIPGMGMAYQQGKTTMSNGIAFNKYSFTSLTGYVSYSPKSFINFQLGKDKMFIGDGYRSLLLSDVANNYPFFKTTVNVWKFQYSSWYSWFYDIYNSNGLQSQFKNKFGTFHYLSWNATKRFNISAFENIIWQGKDSTRSRGFDPNYLNPIIFYRPVEYSLGSSDNAMLGMNMSLKLFNNLKLYGQVVLDEFLLAKIRAQKGWWANKQGFQLGAKYVDAFGIKKLSLQTEFNYVRPYTYTHGTSQQSYSHFNQPLAHPFGANFYEALGIITYKHHRYRLELKGNYAIIGKDTSWSATSNVGQNIFLSYNSHNKEEGNFVGQGIKTTFMQAELKYTFYIIPNINLRIEAGIIQRSLANEKGFIRQTPFIYASIKTSLYNFYRDF